MNCAVRPARNGDDYAYLPNTEVDWAFDGRHVCRVPRCPREVWRRLLQSLKAQAAVFSPGPRYPRVAPEPDPRALRVWISSAESSSLLRTQRSRISSPSNKLNAKAKGENKRTIIKGAR